MDWGILIFFHPSVTGGRSARIRICSDPINLILFGEILIPKI